jgi:hypothetical protein
MRSNYPKATLKTAVLAMTVLLLGAGLAVAQMVNLTAAPAISTMPDGSAVPMWGYRCGTAVSGSTATCAALNRVAGAGWSPVVITVATGQDLTINLTNSLPSPVPTSLVIVGQLGGGLGTTATSVPSPSHENMGTTWPIAATGAVFTPPQQGPRVQSFATEVAPGATTALTWTAPRPGTYLIESGTHPSIQGPMGMYGILLVTNAPTADSTGKETGAGTAYPGVTYDAEVPLLLSEIDPRQNIAVNTAVNTAGFNESATYGPYSAQPVASINLISGGSGYTSAPTVLFDGVTTGATATAVVDTVSGSPTQGQVTGISIVNGGSYTAAPIITFSGGGGNGASAIDALQLSTSSTCSGGALACYPPAVNYTPLYYLVNGVAFDKNNAMASSFPVSPASLAPASGPGAVLVRIVNAGLHMHVPSIVGSLTGGITPAGGFSLIAEDGNPLPGATRVQSEVFMAAGKTYDVMINGPSAGINALLLSAGGSGYNPATTTVSFAGGGGSNANATLAFGLTSISIVAGGTGYVVGDVLTFTGGGFGAAASVSGVDSNGAITGISIANPGTNYTSVPTIGVTSQSATAAGANLVANLSVTGITLASPGSGYTSAPQVIISDTSGGTGAMAVAHVPDLPIYDRELSLSSNAINRDAGMLAYIGGNGGLLPSGGAFGSAVARDDTFNSVVPGKTLAVSDPSKGVIANDTNVYGVKVVGAAVAGLTLSLDGTFTYTGPATSFTYCGNGTTSGPACATVTLGLAPIEAGGGILMGSITYTSTVATTLSIKPPGILSVDKDGLGYPLTVSGASSTTPLSVALSPSGTVSVDQNGGFNATVTGPGTYTFSYNAQNSQGTVSSGTGTVTLIFPQPTGLKVAVVDGADKTTPVADYRWIIEEDRTFQINPNCTQNPPPAGCPTAGSGIVPTFGTNFHTSYMPVVAAGCTGPLSCESGQSVGGVAAVCDGGNGVCRTGVSQQATLDPSQVQLDPTKHYYISVLPGDAANAFNSGNAQGGHGMGGAPIACTPVAPAFTCTSTGTFPAITVLVQPNPFPPSKLSVFVFEDDFPLNGEQDGGGGIDVLSPNEPGLGGFNITLFDDAGGPGDATGQMTYDMFNMPLSNGLAGTVDPATGLDACPISGSNQNVGADGTTSPTGITGTIVTCPKYEADGKTLSPLAGQAVVSNLMPGRYGVVATPAADRIARGEEWLQTNTLDGQKAHDSFLRIGEPSFFQEYGPAGYHVSIGFANPKIINARKAGICGGSDPNVSGNNCNNSITATVTTERMSRTPDERLYSSGDNSSFAFTQCYASFGDPDGEDFAFTKCDQNGNFTLLGLPDGDWRITIFDQWNDMLVDGLSTPVRLSGGKLLNLGQIAMNQWQANIYTKTFFDKNHNGIQDPGEDGLTLVATNNRFRDGSYSNFNNTDLAGNAGFNEIFPLFSWYVIEDDTTRYKSTGVHVVYDAGGPADGTCVAGSTAPCGNSNIGANLANTAEQLSVPADLKVPGARYCASADCPTGDSGGGSTGRVDPPFWFGTEGWQGFSGQNNFVEFGKAPFAPGETGGIHGEVIYASTRPFDDPALLIHTSWTPDVPGVTVNLYKEGTGPDGSTTLTLIDTTKTSSWDDWAQGFRSDGKPNMNCPGQFSNTATTTTPSDLFFFSLYNQPDWLDAYNNGGTPVHTIPYNSQFKCYDGMHNWNQVQPAPYDGMYSFPSVTGMDPSTAKLMASLAISSISEAGNTVTVTTASNIGLGTGATAVATISAVTPTGYNGSYPATVTGANTFTYAAASSGLTAATGGSAVVRFTNCTICIPNPDATDPYRVGTAMLPAGKYVVEMVTPPGYELVKEEDKNILIGDNYIAPVTQEFAGLGNIFILPDQAEVSAYLNSSNPQNPTNTLGRTTLPSHEGDTGSVETFWPCVGALRQVPDFISLFPQSGEVSPFAGAMRNLCDRKEVTLQDQTSALAKFWVFTSTHVAAHFTGVITDDFTSEFDPFSPQFGEKFSPPDLPVSIKDWSGTEIARTYADHWGTYNGLTYSTWEVNPPNPTGYAPTMMVTCMNDPGPIPDPNNPGQMITDPLFNPQYSQFCYEIPFMPGQTQYMDTPVVPTSAFAGAGYNNPDCAYPALTPAIKEVDGDGVGPWVSAAGHTLTITALGDQQVPNNAYSGPQASAAPYNQKTVTRHYGFGNTQGTVTIGGIPATVTSGGWGDTQITIQVPGGTAATNVPTCNIQQQTIFGAPSAPARCGELVITTSTGQQSIDTVTVTIGGKAPTHVAASASIQSAIDAAKPGDLIIIDPTCSPTAGGAAVPCSSTGLHGTTTTPPTQAASQGAHNELLLMWKPVRLQGVGAASSVINANTHPAGKLNDWRARVDCLFGLAPNGHPSGYNPSCGAAWYGFNPDTFNAFNPQVDRLPLEATVGWDASLNGNLAELLQEPSLMGALEGAGITVLSKGVFYPTDPFDPTLLAGFPTGTILFTASNTSTYCPTSATSNWTSNFFCNPSSIDGLTVTNSSQGGGGIFVHGWGHNIQIANNRVQNNAGTLSGGINIGQGEFPPAYLQGGVNAAPGSCQQRSFSLLPGSVLPYCHDVNVNVHNNSISSNSSIGDELFSATPAGAGGISFCTGSDYYKFNYNWVCGNLSTGDGGGFGHMGFSYNGDIEHNTFVFNQSTNPTIAANGGGLIIMGAPDVDPTCGATTDADCVPPLGSVGPSDGTGPNLVVNANLIMGNQAESGTGGGLGLQNVNGSDVVAFPNGCPAVVLCGWNTVTLTNNIIVDNVAGWDGAGISLLDALAVNFVNNTVASNDSTASSGVLFDTIGAPLASTGGTNCSATSLSGPNTVSCPQVAGLVSIQNSATLNANLPASITCPALHGGGTGILPVLNGACRKYSYPLLYNDLFWQNRSYYIGIGSAGPGTLNQQNLVTLFNSFSTTPAPSQSTTGQCTSASYWDIGFRGDTSPSNHGSGVTLNPNYSFLTDAADYGSTAAHNSGATPSFTNQYCNGSRVPPEFGVAGWQVPPGIADAQVPNPIFNLSPTATVDEGNNWINISWGPLAEANPLTGVRLSNYAPAPGSTAINYIPSSAVLAFSLAPGSDFFGNPRKTGGNPVDAGAIEFSAPAPTLASITPSSGTRGSSVNVTLTGTNLTGATAVNVAGGGVNVSNVVVVNSTTITATFTITAGAAATARNVTVVTPGGTSGAVQFTVLVAPAPTLTSIAPNVHVRGGGAFTVTLTGTNFLPGATVTAGANITVGTVTVNSATQITTTFSIGGGAALGPRSVTVTTAGGVSGPVTFTVAGLTSIAPTSGLRGSVVPVTLSGFGLTGTTAVNVSGTLVTPGAFTVVNDTTVSTTFTIGATAIASGRTVTVTTLSGNTNSVTFTVQGPTLTSISPSSATHPTTGTISVPVTLTGTNLTTATGLTGLGTGVTVATGSFHVVSATSVTATLNIASTATVGNRNIAVVTSTMGNTNTVAFTVN